MKTVWSVALSALLVVVCGCSGVFDSDQAVILPAIKLEAPATASAAASFSVTVTLRTGGCTSFDRLVVVKVESTVRIVPWGTNSALGRKGNVVCPANIVDEPHSVQLEPPFSNPFHVTVEQGRLAPVVATVQVQ
jgi:hypothetical protein